MDLILARIDQLEEQARQQASSISLLSSENRQFSSLVQAQDRLLGENEREKFPLGRWIQGSGLEGRKTAWEWSLSNFKKPPPLAPPSTPPASQAGNPSFSPPSLLLFPTELLSLILSCLQPSELPPACLVSFLFLQLASEHLYRDISIWIDQAKLLFCSRDVRGIPRLQPFLSLEKIHRITLERPTRSPKPKPKPFSATSNPISSLAFNYYSLPGSDDDDDEQEGEEKQDFFLTRYDPTESTPLPLTHLVVKFDYDAEGDLESLSPLLAILNPTTLRLEGPTFGGPVPLRLEDPEIEWIYSWFRLKEVVFVGESVIEDESVESCLERSFAPLEEEGVFRYELRLEFKGTAPDQVRRFGSGELGKRLRIAGAKTEDGEEGGLVVEKAVLVARFVASREEEE